ncbi:MAG: hypothetical protein IJ325_08765 [Clostridia bacterium]|nr:hypothetical protein [Clostridia bacterium]
MRKWLSKHPNVSAYCIFSLLFLCIVSFAMYGMTEKQLRLTGAAEEQQFFDLCRSHAENGLALLAEKHSAGEAAHDILSAAEYLELCGENGLTAAQILRENGKTILNGGEPDKELTRILETLTDGRIPYIPPEPEEAEHTESLWNPRPLIRSEQMEWAEKCTGVFGALTEVKMADDARTSVYVCRNLYLVMAARGYPLEFSIYLPYQGRAYDEESCRRNAIRWIKTNVPRDILGTDAEIESCEVRDEEYRMTVRCRNGLMDIYVRNDNGKVSWFNGKMLEI